MAVVGAGAMGRAWLDTLAADRRWQLAALIDPNPDALHSAAEAHALPHERRFAALEPALNHADAVLVVAPPDAHRAACLLALERGLAVFCEKPLAGTLRDGVAVIEAARRSAAPLMVGQGRRWLPHIAAMREAVRSGLIGSLGYLSCQFRIPFRFGGWREQLPEVLIEDLAIHHLDSIRFITGRNGLRLFARSFRPAWSWYAGNPCASIELTLEGELPVSYSGSWVARGPRSSWDGELLLVGAEGALLLREDESVWHYQGEAETPEPLPLPTFTPNGLARGLDIFTRALRGEAAPLPDGEDALLSLALTSAAVASARSGQPVDVAAHLADAGWRAG
jgi:predicted dehydrogenase